MERRSFLASAAGLAATAALPVAAFAESNKITIGFQPIASMLPYGVGVDKGFFKAAGIDVTLEKFADQVKVVEALVGGRIGGCALGTGAATLVNGELTSPGLFKIVAANISSDKSVLDEILVAKGSPIKKISDLKGKKIACAPGAQATNECREILAKNGLGDQSIIEIVPADLIAALGDGRADAVYAYEPSGTIGRIDGKVDIIEVGVRSKYILGSATAPWYGGAGVLSSDWIKANPGSTKKFIEGLKKAMDFVRKDFDGARESLVTYVGVSKRVADAVPPISYTLASEFTASDISYFQKALDFYHDRKMLKQNVNIGSMILRG
jgi:NitT/TauT family transport system substrate-binding protein